MSSPSFKQMPLPAAIQAIRKSIPLSQNQLSRMLNVTPTTISRWERGISIPSPLHLIKLQAHARCQDEKQPIRLALEAKGFCTEPHESIVDLVQVA